MLVALRERDALLGRRVRWQDGEGLGAGIDETGALRVDVERARDHAHRGRGHAQRASLISGHASAGVGGSAATCCVAGGELVPLGLAARAEVRADLVVVAAVRAGGGREDLVVQAVRRCRSGPCPDAEHDGQQLERVLGVVQRVGERERHRLVEALGARRLAQPLDRVEVALQRLRRRPARRATIVISSSDRSGGTSWLGASARAATRPHASKPVRRTGARARTRTTRSTPAARGGSAGRAAPARADRPCRAPRSTPPSAAPSARLTSSSGGRRSASWNTRSSSACSSLVCGPCVAPQRAHVAARRADRASAASSRTARAGPGTRSTTAHRYTDITARSGGPSPCA